MKYPDPGYVHFWTCEMFSTTERKSSATKQFLSPLSMRCGHLEIFKVCLVCDWQNGNSPVSQTKQRENVFLLQTFKNVDGIYRACSIGKGIVTRQRFFHAMVKTTVKTAVKRLEKRSGKIEKTSVNSRDIMFAATVIGFRDSKSRFCFEFDSK